MQQTPKYHRNTYSRGVLTSLSYEAPIQPALMDSAEIFSSESVESQSPPRKSATPLHELRLNRPAHQPQEWLQHVLSRRTIHPRWDLDAHCVPSAVPVDWLTHTTLPLSLLFFSGRKLVCTPLIYVLLSSFLTPPLFAFSKVNAYGVPRQLDLTRILLSPLLLQFIYNNLRARIYVSRSRLRRLPSHPPISVTFATMYSKKG